MVDTFLVNHTPMIQSLESLSKLKKKKKLSCIRIAHSFHPTHTHALTYTHVSAPAFLMQKTNFHF